MKPKEFTRFIHYIGECSESDPIWYCGYMFIDLTVKQADRTIEVLRDRFGITSDREGNQQIIIPSGLAFNIKGGA